MSVKKQRLDQILFNRNLAESKTKAQAMIMAGQIYVEGKNINKSGFNINSNAIIEIKNLGTQTIKTPYGKKKGYTLSPVKNGQPVLKNKGDMEVSYVSIDDTLVPAKILIKLSSGVIKLRLKKIREWYHLKAKTPLMIIVETFLLIEFLS